MSPFVSALSVYDRWWLLQIVLDSNVGNVRLFLERGIDLHTLFGS